MDQSKENDKLLLVLKQRKARCKTAFTKCKNGILRKLDEELLDNPDVRARQDDFDRCFDEVNEIMEKLCSVYKDSQETESEERITAEMEEIDNQYSVIHRKVQERFDNYSSINSLQDVNAGQIGTDMWRQMKRVEIPTFLGEKQKNESWKAAFMACIDKSPASPEYKLLQLRQCLSGDALRAIKQLGHSAAAYSAAKERLERKFGGERRRIAIFLEELDNFPPIRAENAIYIEKFADLLDVAVLNMSEANGTDDLSDGALYHKLQKKMPQSMLTRYHRWIYENEHIESVELLRDWIVLESKFQVIASETVRGMNAIPKNPRKTGYNDRSYVVSGIQSPKETVHIVLVSMAFGTVKHLEH